MKTATQDYESVLQFRGGKDYSFGCVKNRINQSSSAANTVNSTITGGKFILLHGITNVIRRIEKPTERNHNNKERRSNANKTKEGDSIASKVVSVRSHNQVSQ